MRTIARRVATRAANTNMTNRQILTAGAALISYGLVLIVFHATVAPAFGQVVASVAHAFTAVAHTLVR